MAIKKYQPIAQIAPTKYPIPISTPCTHLIFILKNPLLINNTNNPDIKNQL